MGLYCTIYVYATITFEALVRVVARIVDGSVEGRTVSVKGFEIDVVTNEDFDERQAAAGRGDFLYFPYRLEAEEVAPSLDRDSPRELLARLLAGLSEEGFDFVTAADFEDELPNGGRSRA